MKRYISIFEEITYLWNSVVYLVKNGDLDIECSQLEGRAEKSGAIVVSLADDLVGYGLSDKLYQYLKQFP